MLTKQECERFHEEGYLGPYTLLEPGAMAEARARIERELRPSLERPKELLGRHVDNRGVFELCSHASVVRRVADLIGPDLLLWSSNFWLKEPGGEESPWHQDIVNWPIEPFLTVTAWIAIDDCTVENSCLQVIPGSHRKLLPAVKARPETQFLFTADPALFDAGKAVDVEMRAGSFLMFNERLLHHSEPNRSNKRRLALSARLTAPFVKVYGEKAGLPSDTCLLVGGTDRFGFNRIGVPPA